MTFTESDLRDLLDERTAHGPERETSVTKIVRRGRRMLMIRWGVSAMLAGAAALAVFMLIPGQQPDSAQLAAAAKPSGASTDLMDHPVHPPKTLDAMGIGDAVSAPSAGRADLKLTPKSVFVLLRCTEPDSWGVLTFKDRGSGQTVRCANGEVRIPVTTPGKSVRIWVFPPDASIVDKPLKDCAMADEEKGLCDGKYSAAELQRYDIALSLAADVGARNVGVKKTGSWTAAVYSRP